MGLSDKPAVIRLDLAELQLPDQHPEGDDGSIPVYGYVVDHPDGLILFDTGVGFGNAFIDEAYQPTRARLDKALISAGFDPAAVVAIVNSHLHFDHCGQNPSFHGSSVPIYQQRTEVGAVEADELYPDRSWALAPTPQQRLIDGDHSIAEGVSILSTPGHTEGHQSLAVTFGGATIVIAGQCIWRASEFVEERVTDANVGSPHLKVAALESIRRIKALQPTTVHFSHCAALEFG